MLPILVAMILILAVAAVVVLFVAFTHRGEDIPRLPWLNDALQRAAEAVPVLTEDDADAGARASDVPHARRPTAPESAA